MKTLTSLFIVSIILVFPTLSSATVSGEVFGQKQQTYTVSVVKYFTGPKGGCYTMVKPKTSGKMIKKYVNKKFCVKK